MNALQPDSALDPPLALERRFFDALLAADPRALDGVLTDDFVLVDVMRGGEITRATLLDAVGEGAIRFEGIDVLESRVRRYGSTAVVTGRTRMRGHAGAQPWSVHSRYTHVFVEKDGRWR